MSRFPERFILELQRTGREYEDYLHAAVTLAARTDCPVVATNEVCFLTPDEFDAHEARVCIGDGRTLNDPRRPRHFRSNSIYARPKRWRTYFKISRKRLRIPFT